MTHGSLFSGIGGFDLAAEWMGWENVFHCEWNEFGKTVLKHYWPNSISYHDITKTDFTVHEGTIDVLSGGFPCQPYSSAGKRLGKEDERHLWPEMLRVIREVKPRWVVGENVLGLVNWNGGLVFHEVQTDLEAQGYEVQPYVLPAAGVGAPHIRQRVFFVAYSDHAGAHEPVQTEPQRSKDDKRREGVALVESREDGGHGDASDADGMGQQGQGTSRYAGCSEENRKGETNPFDNAYERWQRFPTEPSVRSRDDGFPKKLDGISVSKWRAETLSAYGNAVVPQVVHRIFNAIQNYESNYRTAK